MDTFARTKVFWNTIAETNIDQDIMGCVKRIIGKILGNRRIE